MCGHLLPLHRNSNTTKCFVQVPSSFGALFRDRNLVLWLMAPDRKDYFKDRIFLIRLAEGKQPKKMMELSDRQKYLKAFVSWSVVQNINLLHSVLCLCPQTPMAGQDAGIESDDWEACQLMLQGGKHLLGSLCVGIWRCWWVSLWRPDDCSWHPRERWPVRGHAHGNSQP